MGTGRSSSGGGGGLSYLDEIAASDVPVEEDTSSPAEQGDAGESADEGTDEEGNKESDNEEAASIASAALDFDEDSVNPSDGPEASFGILSADEPSLVATLGDVNLASTNDTVSLSATEAIAGTQNLTVTANFSASSAVTERTITIRVEQGLTLKGAQGFNGMSWNGSNLGQLAGSVYGVWTPDTPIAFPTPASAGSGTLTYTFLDTGESRIELATLTVQVSAFAPFAGTPTTRTFTDAVKVTASQKLADSTVKTSPLLKLESYTITTATSTGINGVGADTDRIVAPGQSLSLTFTVNPSSYGSANYALYYKDLTVAILIPKGISLDTSSPVTLPAASSLTQSQIGLSSPSAYNANYTQVMLKISNFSISNASFYLNVTVDDSATDGAYSFLYNQPACSFTPYGAGAEDLQNSPIEGLHKFQWFPSLKVSTVSPTIEVLQPNAYTCGYIDPAIMTDGETVWLATPKLNNPSPNPTGAIGFKVVYPNSILARGVYLPVGSDGTAYKLKVTLTNDTVRSYDEYATDLVGAGGAQSSVLFNLTAQGVDQSLGISKLEYEATGFMGAYGVVTNPGSQFSGLFAVHGRFTSEYSPSFSISYTTRTGGLPAGEDWSDATTVSISKTVFQDASSYYWMTTTITGGSASTLQAGDSRHVKYRLSHTAYPNTHYAPFVKGIVYYLRETPYLTINPDSITVKEEMGVNGPVTTVITDSVDKDGSRVWKVVAQDARAAMGLKPINSVLEYDFKVKLDAPTTTLDARDLIFMRPLPRQGNSPYIEGGGGGSPTVVDVFDVDGTGEGNRFVCPIPSSIAIVAYPDFSVSTFSRLVMGAFDSGWSTFDASTQNYLGLNQYGQVSYLVRAANNNNAEAGTFVVHVPIPKRSGDASGWGQDAAFGFSAALKGEVDTGGYEGVEVLYSDEYIPDTSSSADLSSFKSFG